MTLPVQAAGAAQTRPLSLIRGSERMADASPCSSAGPRRYLLEFLSRLLIEQDLTAWN